MLHGLSGVHWYSKRRSIKKSFLEYVERCFRNSCVITRSLLFSSTWKKEFWITISHHCSCNHCDKSLNAWWSRKLTSLFLLYDNSSWFRDKTPRIIRLVTHDTQVSPTILWSEDFGLGIFIDLNKFFKFFFHRFDEEACSDRMVGKSFFHIDFMTIVRSLIDHSKYLIISGSIDFKPCPSMWRVIFPLFWA